MVSCGHTPALPPVKTLNVTKDALENGKVVESSSGTDDSQVIVGCGQTYTDEKVIVVDPMSKIACPPDVIGEIWVSGQSVAQGYWNRAAETDETFRAFLSDTGEGPFLRTGDLGLLRYGELYVTGRLKDLIIIRGRNIYPQDIEFTVECSHPAMRPGCGAAFPVDINDEEKLVVVQEIQRGQEVNAESIINGRETSSGRRTRSATPFHRMIKAGSIAKTSRREDSAQCLSQSLS